MKISESQPEIPEFLATSVVKSITGISQLADSIAWSGCDTGFGISASSLHAATGTGCDYAIRSTDTRFMSSMILAHGFTHCRQWMNAGFQISDWADHASGLFDVRFFVTHTGSACSGNPREPEFSNNTVQPTASRAGCCRKSRFDSAFSHGGCKSTRRAFTVSACFHDQVSGSCG